MLSYLLPLLAGAFLFRATVVTLRNGQLGAALLLVLSLVILSWERHKWFIGGLLIAFLALKPTLGLPLLGLIGLWLLRQRKFTALAGILVTSIILFLARFLHDPGWVAKFLSFGAYKLSSNFGISPTLWGISNMVCNHNPGCGLWLGAGLIVVLLAGLIYWLLQRRSPTSPALVIILVIPVIIMVTH